MHLCNGMGWLREADLETTKELDAMESLTAGAQNAMESLTAGAQKGGQALGDALSSMSSMIAEGLQTPPKPSPPAVLQPSEPEHSPSNWGSPPPMVASPIDNSTLQEASRQPQPGGSSGSITGLGIRAQASQASQALMSYWSPNGGPRGD